MLVKKISLSHYFGKCLLVVNADHDEFSAWLKRIFGVKPASDSPGQMLPMVKDGETPTYVIYLQRFNWRIDEQALAVHELFHLCGAVLKDAGVRDEEAAAYFLQHLVSEAWLALSSLNHKTN